MKTQQELVDMMNRDQIKLASKPGGCLSNVNVLHVEKPQMLAMLALVRMPDGCYRVISVSWYLNRAHRAQATLWLKDFEDLDEAEMLTLQVSEMHGALAFGDVWKVSIGSGRRFVKTLD